MIGVLFFCSGRIRSGVAGYAQEPDTLRQEPDTLRQEPDTLRPENGAIVLRDTYVEQSISKV